MMMLGCCRIDCAGMMQGLGLLSLGGQNFIVGTLQPTSADRPTEQTSHRSASRISGIYGGLAHGPENRSRPVCLRHPRKSTPI